MALAGIMGGLESEVTEGSGDVLIESAHFDPLLVRSGADRLGLRTDASHRFERGADPGACLDAATRAAGLIVELPILAFFFQQSKWSLLAALIPTYWPMKIFWVASEGGNYWGYLVVGLVFHLALLGVLLRRFDRVMHR